MEVDTFLSDARCCVTIHIKLSLEYLVLQDHIVAFELIVYHGISKSLLDPPIPIVSQFPLPLLISKYCMI